jgi:hypothetical protein
VFSAGNTYFYIGSRILFGLALEGKAPKLLAKCTKRGVPIYSVIIMVLFSLLGKVYLTWLLSAYLLTTEAFMQVSERGTLVLNWWIIFFVLPAEPLTFTTLLGSSTCCLPLEFWPGPLFPLRIYDSIRWVMNYGVWVRDFLLLNVGYETSRNTQNGTSLSYSLPTIFCVSTFLAHYVRHPES